MVGAGGRIFVFWFSKTQENAFPDVSLRLATVYVFKIAKKFHSAENWGGHGPRPSRLGRPCLFSAQCFSVTLLLLSTANLNLAKSDLADIFPGCFSSS